MSRRVPEDSKNFESIAKILVDHYSGVHLREGKSRGGRNANPRPGFRYTGKGRKPKGKSKGFPDELTQPSWKGTKRMKTLGQNSIEELDDTADAGHAIQLQLAAHAVTPLLVKLRAKAKNTTPQKKQGRR